MRAGPSDRRFLEALLATTAAGCICCPLNPRWSSAETTHALRTCTPALALASACTPPLPLPPTVATLRLGAAESAQSSLQAPPGAPRRQPGTQAGPAAQPVSTEALIATHLGAPLQPRAPPCGTALICFTSGASAAAKGVAVSHAALHLQSLSKLAVVGYAASDVFLHTAPLFHIGAPWRVHAVESPPATCSGVAVRSFVLPVRAL